MARRGRSRAWSPRSKCRRRVSERTNRGVTPRPTPCSNSPSRRLQHITPNKLPAIDRRRITHPHKHKRTHTQQALHTPHAPPFPSPPPLPPRPTTRATASDGKVLGLSRSRFVRPTACPPAPAHPHWLTGDWVPVGTQIAPFLPISGPRSTLQTVCGVFIFLLRLPFFLSIAGSYLLVVRWLPVGSLIRKAWLWSILGVCGVWWVDLQVEGVRRGCVAAAIPSLPPTD